MKEEYKLFVFISCPGILPTLKSERSGIKNTVCALFERWWTLGIPGKEELMGNTVLCLLDRSTQLDAAVRSTVMLNWRWREIWQIKLNIRHVSYCNVFCTQDLPHRTKVQL